MMSLEDEFKAAALLDSGDVDGAVRMLKPMADDNSPYALLCLGWIYDSGKTGDRSTELAALYYGKAAGLGVSRGFFELGRLKYREGLLIEARDSFFEGSEIENIQCLTWLGLMTLRGEGGVKDVNKGIDILRICADKGQLRAKRELCKIELQEKRSILSRISTYNKIIWISVLTFFETLRDPYSERGYR